MKDGRLLAGVYQLVYLTSPRGFERRERVARRPHASVALNGIKERWGLGGNKSEGKMS